MKNEYDVRGEVVAIIIKRKDGTTLETLIDVNDLDKVNSIPNKWSVYWNKTSKTYYARTTISAGCGRKELQLHRFLMDAKDGVMIDHVNHDTLDNRRSTNLREVSRSENGQNRKGAQSNSKTGIRGIYFNRRNNKYRVRLEVQGKYHHIGYFEDIHEAEKASIEARKKHMPFSQEASI